MELVVTPDEMRKADEATISSGTPGVELMDRAAHACSLVVLRALGGSYGKRAVVVAGKGNNGGDGIACARHLALSGVVATVLLIGEPAGDAAAHLEIAQRIAPRGRFRTEQWSAEGFERAGARADVIVDAIFGTGLHDAPRGDAAAAIAAINAAHVPVVAVDIPSGVSGADGCVPGEVVIADVTLAIQSLKVGHVVLPGASHCGRIDVADIGIRVDGARTLVAEPSDVAAVLPTIEPDTHKYRVGALAVLAGSTGMTGAAILTAQGAIRSGAGLVVMGVPSSTLEVFETTVTEAIKVPLPEVEGHLDAKAVDEFGDRLERCRALAIGPGLGRAPQAVAMVRRALDVRLPIVVDGDGLWALGEILRDEPDILRTRSHEAVLTPHTGEFAYLGGDASADRVEAVRGAAARLGAIIHLKGRRAITASPQGTVWVNATGNPGLATGGSGDVLTGVVGSLTAQGVPPVDATWAGTFLHGLAGDIAATRIGRRPLAARDIPDSLPSALREVERAVPRSGRLRTVVPAT